MKISGNATLQAPADRVFQALNDPDILVRTIPGCQKLEETAPDAYRMTVYAGVASIKGIYQGDVSLTDHEAPRSFRMKASGAGAPGTVDADVLVTLAESADGGTVLQYDAEAVVGGMVGGVGQRMLTGVAKKTAGEFFKAVDGILNGEASEAPAQLRGGESHGEPPTDAGQLRPTVFSAPVASRSGRLGDEFALGVAAGAAVALLGALVGARAARAARGQ